MPELWNAGFETQDGGYGWSHSVVGSLMRFEVRSGDRWRHDGSGRERAEIASYAKLDYGQTYTVRTKLMVEEGAKNTAEWLLLGQFHQTEDAGEAGVSPPVALEMAGEHLQVVARHTTQAITTTWPTTKVLYKDAAPLQRGRWYDLQIEVRFDPFGQGSLKVWRDGTELVSYAGPLGYNDKVGPYWKNGIYRESSPETMAAQYSDLTVTPGKLPPVVTAAPSKTLVGTDGDDRLTGSKGKDLIVGHAGNDVLNGRNLKDVLKGGEGQDAFVFNTLFGSRNVDRIVDFNRAEDIIHIENKVYKGIGRAGTLAKDAFVVGTKAKDAEDRIIHDRKTGTLSFDPDGTGAVEAVAFATVKKYLVLTHADILVI